MHLNTAQWQVLRECIDGEENLQRVLSVLGVQGAEPLGKGQSVLVVDDDPTIIAFIHCVLEKNGYLPMISTSAAASLSVLRIKPPDLILTDMAMPDMDGNEFYARLRQIPETAHTPVIFITGTIIPEEETELNRKSEEGKCYMAKPFNAAKLLSIISAQLTKKRTHQPARTEAIA